MAACLLLLVLALPWWRQTLEARMWTHMMLQLPALACCGAWLARPPSKTRTTQRWNAHGITGLCFCAVVLSLSMVPRYLDLAVFSLWIDTLKYASFVLCGMALRHSWHPAGRVLQGFFLGNVLPMTAVVGYLYQEAPLRVCNAYGLQDQQTTGLLLSVAAASVGLIWLSLTTRELMQREAELDIPSTTPHSKETIDVTNRPIPSATQ